MMKAVQSAIILAVACHGARVKKQPTVKMAGISVHNYRPNMKTWVLLFEEGSTTGDIQKVCNNRCRLMGNPDKGGAAFASFRGSQQELEEVVHGFEGKLSLLEPDETDSLEPEDDEMVAAEYTGWSLGAIGAESRTGTGAGVHIYVQDTGIRATHDDFGGRVVPTLDMTRDIAPLLECATEDFSMCSSDGRGHGTHCAGSAAGMTYGVAPEATLHAVKTLSDKGSGARSWQYGAIDWVATNAILPAVLSMSLGGAGADAAYPRVIGAATDAGITVVVAAGNSNADACDYSPAFTPQAITVGATDRNWNRAYYSNFGECVDIMGPGSSIISASHMSDTGSSTKSGTSMACPHVSGAAALLLESDPTMTRDDIMASLVATAKTGVVSGLMGDDPDLFLWVGA